MRPEGDGVSARQVHADRVTVGFDAHHTPGAAKTHDGGELALAPVELASGHCADASGLGAEASSVAREAVSRTAG